MAIVEEECDETIYWMEILAEAEIINENIVADIKSEAGQILAMIVASIKTARLRK